MKPLISICILTYNHQSYIEKGLIGVFSQSIISQCEIIIGDDCSQDSTVEIIEACLLECPCNVEFIPRKLNIGPGRNYHDVITRASGRYIAYLDGDDAWVDNKKLEKQLNLFYMNPKLGLVGTHASGSIPKFSNNQNSTEYYSVAPLDLLSKNVIVNSSVLVNREVFFWARSELDLLSPGWVKSFIAEDYCTWIMISSKYDLWVLREPCVDINVEQGSLSRPNDKLKKIAYLKSVLKMKKMYLDYYEIPLVSISRWTVVVRISLIIFSTQVRNLVEQTLKWFKKPLSLAP